MYHLRLWPQTTRWRTSLRLVCMYASLHQFIYVSYCYLNVFSCVFNQFYAKLILTNLPTSMHLPCIDPLTVYVVVSRACIWRSSWCEHISSGIRDYWCSQLDAQGARVVKFRAVIYTLILLYCIGHFSKYNSYILLWFCEIFLHFSDHAYYQISWLLEIWFRILIWQI